MNTPHPLDIATDNLSGNVRRLMLRAFLADNVIDANERAALDAHDEETGVILAYRQREVAADSWKRNGNTRITRDRFREAGAELVDLATERQARTKIVNFPTDRNAG